MGVLDSLERHGRIVDATIAFALFLLSPFGVPSALATLPLALRRIWPWPVLVVVIASLVVFELSSRPPVAPQVAGLVAVYTVVSRASPVQGMIAGALALAVPATGLLQRGPADWLVVQVLGVFGAAVLGRVTPKRREVIEHEWVIKEAGEQQAFRAVVLERGRLAGELHDTVGHAMSIVVLRAGVAREVFDSDPEQAKEALGAIEEAARTAMTDLRRLLDVLSAPDQRQDYGPPPGLADLPRLVDDLRATGLQVSLSRTGSPPVQDRTVELAAYRICEEALVNTLKHAGPTAVARMEVEAGPDAVKIVVTDSGSREPWTAPALGGGRGLLFLSERAAFVGGTFKAGHRAQGGFEVRAVLPYGKAGS
ncbi:histidine kinase [Streptosporangium soli]|nr:histidine kinase [Streptosporangium sp. KLBMP 9127]